MNMRRWAIFLLFLWGMLEGARIIYVPSSSILLTSFHHQAFSFQQYGILFLPLSVGGVLGALWGGWSAEKRGLRYLFVICIISHLLGVYIFGGTMIASVETTLSLALFFIGHFFLGIASGTSITMLTILIGQLYPQKVFAAISGFYISFPLGAMLYALFVTPDPQSRNVLHVPFLMGALFLLLFFLIDLCGILTSKPLEKSKKKTLHGVSFLLLSTFFCGATELLTSWLNLYTTHIKGFTLLQSRHIFFGYLVSYAVGRAVFALILYRFSFRLLYLILPIAFLLCAALLPFVEGALAVAMVVYVGGFFLENVITMALAFGQKVCSDCKSFVTGALTAAFLFGLGIAPFIFGLIELPLSLFPLFVILMALCLLLTNFASLRKYINIS